MEDRGTIKVFEGNILEQIRQRPAMYLGTRSLSLLRAFLDGYSRAYGDLGKSRPQMLPKDIHDWVAYRLHFVESTSGYVNMILKHSEGEATALIRFFELLDEHSARKATTVARIRHHRPPGFDFRRLPASIESPPVETSCAAGVSIVVYTEDPGFFLVNEDPAADYPPRSEFYPSLSWLHPPYHADPEYTTVLDQQRFDRLAFEREAFDRASREKRAAIKLKHGEQAGGIN